MSIEENKAFIRRFMSDLNQANWAESIGEFLQEPYDEVIKGHAQFRAAFSDYHFTIEELIAEGDKVMVRGTVHATHNAEFPVAELKGVVATGKKLEWSEVQIFKIADGKIADGLLLVDGVSRLQQLGVLA